jgi:hypothetical protein
MGKEQKSTAIAVVALLVVLVLVYLFFVRQSSSADHRILLVASDVLAQVGGISKFASYVSDKSVAVVAYNYDRTATYAELGDLVKAHMDSTGASRVRSIGIMYHTPNRYNLQCFASDPAKSTVSGSPETFESFRRFVVALRAAYGVEDVDLISCDVVSAETSVLSALDYNGARVNASTNTTGQVKQGPVGDWVLESGNVNLIGRYFNASITTTDIALSSRFKTLSGPRQRVQNNGAIPFYNGDPTQIERAKQQELFNVQQAGMAAEAQASQNRAHVARANAQEADNERKDRAFIAQQAAGRGFYDNSGNFIRVV